MAVPCRGGEGHGIAAVGYFYDGHAVRYVYGFFNDQGCGAFFCHVFCEAVAVNVGSAHADEKSLRGYFAGIVDDFFYVYVGAALQDFCLQSFEQCG